MMLKTAQFITAVYRTYQERKLRRKIRNVFERGMLLSFATMPTLTSRGAGPGGPFSAGDGSISSTEHGLSDCWGPEACERANLAKSAICRCARDFRRELKVKVFLTKTNDREISHPGVTRHGGAHGFVRKAISCSREALGPVERRSPKFPYWRTGSAV